MSEPISADESRSRLESAFQSRADGVAAAEPLIGLFGDGLPEALIAAHGGRAVEIKAPPLDRETPVSDIVSSIAEPFLDAFTASFLHRFASGRFDQYAALIFCRDDAAALAAYQYALELRRQGMVGGEGPRLHLWRLVHGTHAAAHRFNMQELDRLRGLLTEVAGDADPDRARSAFATEAERASALSRLEENRGVGASAFAWRQAGRWLEAGEHARLLHAAIEGIDNRASGRRIGLVGTAFDLPTLWDICTPLGDVVADLQPYGSLWPACHAGGPDDDALLRSLAAWPHSPRANPAENFSRALRDGLAGCDVVVAACDANDDTLGWELPGLRKDTKERDIPFVDLGFRPFRPDDAWRAQAEETIRIALS